MYSSSIIGDFPKVMLPQSPYTASCISINQRVVGKSSGSLLPNHIAPHTPSIIGFSLSAGSPVAWPYGGVTWANRWGCKHHVSTSGTFYGHQKLIPFGRSVVYLDLLLGFPV